MIDNLREKFFGRTVADEIGSLPYDLEIDSIPFRDIVGSGRRAFALSGDNLLEFVSRSLETMLACGAVLIAADTNGRLRPTRKYGDIHRDIISNIINEWEKNGRPDPDIDFIWFTIHPEFWEKSANS